MLFHLNLMYSSIDNNDHKKVIDKCYWPLLNIVQQLKIPTGIELTGLTLQMINNIDPSWVKQLKELANQNIVEVIGSGYSQIIAPLIPAKLNHWNQKIGRDIYEEILGFHPETALINEMAYSAGSIEHYLNNGYKAIISEWNNSYRHHSEWSKEWLYYPQKALGTNNLSIPIIWTDSISFQKFQRYAHGDISSDDYIEYLTSLPQGQNKCYPLYANDIEIFDYRPGRYQTEAQIHPEGEWKRIATLLEFLQLDPHFNFIKPKEVLKNTYEDLAFNILKLESPEEPIPVKKQGKYNITRWAVTGRDDVKINTYCHRIYETIKETDNAEEWRKLCYLWSSDFRTHITPDRMSAFLKEINTLVQPYACLITKNNLASDHLPQYHTSQKDFKFTITTQNISASLNLRRGLAIDTLIFKDIDNRPLIGTIPHGYYDDIALGADFYSGHTIIEPFGKHKITDLEPVSNPNIQNTPLWVSVVVAFPSIGITKEYHIYHDAPQIDILYSFNLHLQEYASIKTGIIKFIPESFNEQELYYRTNNGGHHPETFAIKGHTVAHTTPTNHLISTSHCLGATEGWLEIGDDKKNITITSSKDELYHVPMIAYQHAPPSYFIRCYHSIGEYDETRKGKTDIDGSLLFSIKGSKI